MEVQNWTDRTSTTTVVSPSTFCFSARHQYLIVLSKAKVGVVKTGTNISKNIYGLYVLAHDSESCTILYSDSERTGSEE